MTLLKEQPMKMKSEEIERMIDRAIKKVQGQKENDLCKFLPGPTGGYMHHFTLKKLKGSNPQQLSSLIEQYILHSEMPKVLDPKQRAPRGSRKKRDVVSFSRTDIEKVLEMARKYGEKELVAKFSPKRSLTSLKRELIRSIRENHLSHELWNAYCESIHNIHSNSEGR